MKAHNNKYFKPDFPFHSEKSESFFVWIMDDVNQGSLLQETAATFIKF